jgi:hypothetical protein
MAFTLKARWNSPATTSLSPLVSRSARDRANCWMRVQGTIPDWWDGRRDVDDEFSLDTVRHPGGGRRGQAGLRNLQAPDRCPPFRWYASRHSPLTELRLQLVAAGRAGKAAGGIVVFRSVLTGRRGLRRNDPSSGGEKLRPFVPVLVLTLGETSSG